MQDERELLWGNTPTLMPAVLKTGPQHGYGIAREINHRTNNSLKFSQGTLYPVLHALEEAGFVMGVWETVDDERPRCVNTIMESGATEIARRAEVWSQFVVAMDQVIGGGATGGKQPA